MPQNRHKIELALDCWHMRPYQQQALDSFWHGGSGVVVLPCGAGKTIVGAAAMAQASATTLILGAAYTLWLVKRTIFGAVANHHVAEMKDLDGRELLVLAMLALAVLLLGIWPAPLLEVMSGSIGRLVTQILGTKL